jgi:hypothetical protein
VWVLVWVWVWVGGSLCNFGGAGLGYYWNSLLTSNPVCKTSSPNSTRGRMLRRSLPGSGCRPSNRTRSYNQATQGTGRAYGERPSTTCCALCASSAAPCVVSMHNCTHAFPLGSMTDIGACMWSALLRFGADWEEEDRGAGRYAVRFQSTPPHPPPLLGFGSFCHLTAGTDSRVPNP